MLLYYVTHDAALMPHIPSLLIYWVHIRFLNWLGEKWAYRDLVAPPQFNKLWLQMKLKEAWEPHFPAGYLPEPSDPPPHATRGDMRIFISQANNDAAVAASGAESTRTNASAGDRSHATASEPLTESR